MRSTSGRPATGCAGRSSMPRRMSPVRSAMGKAMRSLVWGARSQTRADVSRMAMVWRSAPHHGKRGLNGGRSRESMDGGTADPYSHTRFDENACRPAKFRSSRSALRRRRRDGFQHGGCHRPANRPACVGRVLLALGPSRRHHAAAPHLAATPDPDRRPQRRRRPSDQRCAASGKLRQLHPGTRPGAGRQRADHVRRDAVHHRARRPHFLGEPLHGHTIVAMAAAVVGLAISVAGSLQPAHWPAWPSR